MTTLAMTLAAGHGGFHWSPGLASIVVIVVVLGLGFALVKWAGAPWWVLALGIIFGILLAETHFLGPGIAQQLSHFTHGNLL